MFLQASLSSWAKCPKHCRLPHPCGSLTQHPPSMLMIPGHGTGDLSPARFPTLGFMNQHPPRRQAPGSGPGDPHPTSFPVPGAQEPIPYHPCGPHELTQSTQALSHPLSLGFTYLAPAWPRLAWLPSSGLPQSYCAAWPNLVCPLF